MRELLEKTMTVEVTERRTKWALVVSVNNEQDVNDVIDMMYDDNIPFPNEGIMDIKTGTDDTGYKDTKVVIPISSNSELVQKKIKGILFDAGLKGKIVPNTYRMKDENQ